jgi:hypothetical protein
MPIPPREEQGELGTNFLKLLNFLISFIYIIFIYIKVLTYMYFLCTDVGPVHLTEFTRLNDLLD